MKKPWYSGLQRLIGSSKAWVVLAAIIGIIVMNVYGQIEGPRALEAITWMVGIWLGAVAVEDGASNLGGRKGPGDSSQYIATLMEMLGSLFETLKPSEPLPAPEEEAAEPVPPADPPIDSTVPVTVDKEE